MAVYCGGIWRYINFPVHHYGVIWWDMPVYDGFSPEHEHFILVQDVVVFGTCLHILSSFIPGCTLLARLKGADLLRP
jgi:hypothetical protein